MSFDCRYKDAKDHCRRFDGECRPGAPGCVLYGRFTFVSDRPASDRRPTDAGSRQKAENGDHQSGDAP